MNKMKCISICACVHRYFFLQESILNIYTNLHKLNWNKSKCDTLIINCRNQYCKWFVKRKQKNYVLTSACIGHLHLKISYTDFKCIRSFQSIQHSWLALKCLLLYLRLKTWNATLQNTAINKKISLFASQLILSINLQLAVIV